MVKVVMRLPTSDAKKRTKALQTASGFLGVVSVSWDRDLLIVVGEGIDSVALTAVLRKKMDPVGVELLSVGPYWKDDEAITWSPPPSPSPVSYNYAYKIPVQPHYHHPYYHHPYPYKERIADEEKCSIL